MSTVGEVVVESLVRNKISRVFCVPGKSVLGFLDALYGLSDVDTVTCRHESGAGYMALADARLTGNIGVACVSAGPGACNASIAVHTAQQDAVPFILIVGQVLARNLQRDAWQHIDYRAMFSGISKWTAEIVHPDGACEIMMRAMQIARSGRPGPVVISIPEDVLTLQTQQRVPSPSIPHRSVPHPDDLSILRTWLQEAKRPLIIAGGNSRDDQSRRKLHSFSQRWKIPVAVSFRHHDIFKNDDPYFVGELGFAKPAEHMRLLHKADLLLVLDAELTEITTQGYTFPSTDSSSAKLVHVHRDNRMISTLFSPHLAMDCDASTVIDGLGHAQPSEIDAERDVWIRALGESHRALSSPRAIDTTDGLPFEYVAARLGQCLADDAIVTIDAGAFAAPVYRLVPFAPPQRLLSAMSGAMGFGIPAAVSAALRHPTAQVVCLVGDGGFLMTGSELAVALEHRLAIKVIVSENGGYGSIRIHQLRQYPGRTIGTTFSNPDIVQIGQAFGFNSTEISSHEEIGKLDRALASSEPELVVVRTSNQAILPTAYTHRR